MRRTNTYNLEMFESGSFYLASADYRRFTTLDYNLKTYIGIVGNGVLKGWDIKILSSKTIKVNPGCGFIDGLYTESTWYLDPVTKLPKRKNQAVSDGDDIFEEIPGWSSPEANSWVGGFYDSGGSSIYDVLVFDKLGPDGEDSNFDGVIDGVLQPHYKEPPDNYINNPLVKAIPKNQSTFLLENNSDNYILITRKSNNPYETFSEIFVSQVDESNDSKLLLAKITVRNNSISKIDYDGVFKAKSLESTSGKLAERLLKQHHHGGEGNYDPPKINLKTDLRKSYFVGINNDNNIFRLENLEELDNPKDFVNGCIFAILSSVKTSIALEHSHYYEMNDDGNGFTHYIVDNQSEQTFHYHIIEDGIITQTMGNYQSIKHIHTLSKKTNIENIDNIVVRINNKIINRNNYKFFTKNWGLFVLFKNDIVDYQSGKYKSNFSLIDGQQYSFEEETDDVSQFIVNMINDFNNRFGDSTSYANLQTQEAQEIKIRSPFAFQTDKSGENLESGKAGYIISDPVPINVWPTGNSGSLFSLTNSSTDLFFQLLAFIINLVKENDKVMILPNLARFITLEATQIARSDDVEVEILQNVEVSGKLSSQNISYIDAEKFKNGIFELSYIPFLSHSEYISRNFNLFKFNTFSNDMVDFRIVPILSSLNDTHYHKILVDKYGDGKTIATYVNDELSVFKTVVIDETETIVLIDHIHSIKNGIITNTISTGLNQFNGNDNQKEHNHYVIKTPLNNSTSVFCINEDKDGNLFLGTSNGLLNKATSGSYKINIEGSFYYYPKGNLYTSLLMASNQHLLETERYILFTSSSALESEGNLITEGDKSEISSIVVFYEGATNVEKSIRFGIKIELVGISLTSGFGRTEVKSIKEYDEEDEEILYETSPPEGVGAEDGEKFYQVKVNFHKQPIWNGYILDDGRKYFASQKKILRSSIEQGNEFWNEVFISTNPPNIIRKIIKSQDYLLACGDNGVKVTSLDNPDAFKDTNINENIYDIMEVSSDVILATSKNGLYKTDNFGWTWANILNIDDIKEITRDYSLDKSSYEDGHFHYLITDINGNGNTSGSYLINGDSYPDWHVHEIEDWQIKKKFDHIHNIISTLFFRTKNNKIYKSIDSGNIWTNIVDIPLEYSNVETIFAAFNKIFIGTADGLAYFDSETSQWHKTDIQRHIFCFNWLYNLIGFYIGSNNKVYVSYDGNNFQEHISLDDNLLPSIFVNQVEITRGFVYNNLNQSINFKEYSATITTVTTSPNYDWWYSKKWDNTISFDIIINNSTIFSTKTNVDIRKTSGYDFNYINNRGQIDFEIRTRLSSNINYGDSEIIVESSDGFKINKEILIIKLEDVLYNGKQYSSQKITRRKISSISNKTLFLDSPIFENIDIDSDVKLIYKLTEKPSISIDIYNPKITSIGKKTHMENDDALSQKSTNMPFKLSEVFMNNFNQLVLYSKYSIYDIHKYFKNWQDFFMRYDRSPSDENYIGKYIDIDQSRLQNSQIDMGTFNPILSSLINVVTMGKFDYKEMAFVGTNGGLFAGIPTNNFNHDWFLIPNNIFGSVYDIMCIDENRVIVLGSNGVFVNQDSEMTEWEKLSSVVSGEGRFIRYRWMDYSGARVYDWWKQWNNDVNLKDADLTNSIILGGKNFVLITNNNGKSWSFSKINKYNIYDAVVFSPLSNGSALLGLNNALSKETEYLYLDDKNKVSLTTLKTAILKTNGVGEIWDSEVFSFKDINLIITNIETTQQNNTKINFDTTYNDTFIAQNVLVGLPVSINNINTVIVSNSGDEIILKNTDISLSLHKNDMFKINPNKVNNITEAQSKNIILGTTSGLFHDKNTYYEKNTVIGSVTGIGKEAIVMSIDIEGFITIASEQSSFQRATSKIVCILDKNVDTNELAGKKIIFYNEIAPALFVLSPLPNEVIESSTISVNVSTTMFDVKTSGFVALQLDGGEITYFNDTNFVINNLTYGQHQLKITLTDTFKNPLRNNFSERILYFTNKSNDTDPYIVIEYPQNKEIIKSSAFYAKVSIYNFNTSFEGALAYSVDGETRVIVPYQPNNTYSILFNTLSVDEHSIKFMLLDADNNETEFNSTVNLTLSNNYPSIFVISPVNNSLVTSNSINVTYDIKNFYIPSNGKVKITINENNVIYSSDQTSYLITGLLEGVNQIKVQLVDNDLKDIGGDYTSDLISTTVDTAIQQTPSIAIFSPSDGSVIETGNSVAISFTVSNFEIPVDGGILIYLNNNLLTFWTKNDPYTLTLSQEGQYTIDVFLAQSITQRLNNPQAQAKLNLISQESTQTTITVDTTATTTATVTETIQATSPLGVSSSSSSLTEQVTPSTFLKGDAINIISNSASSASGAISVEINGIVGEEYTNSYFKIIGDYSTLYVNFVNDVSEHEFDNGYVIVSNDQKNAIYKNYNIKSQYLDKIEIDQIIGTANDPNLSDIQPKQKIILVQDQRLKKELNLWINYERYYNLNELAGNYLYIDGSSDSQMKVISNTQKNIVVTLEDNTLEDGIINLVHELLQKQSYLYLGNTIFSPLKTFNNKKTSKEISHHHDAELMDVIISGEIDYIDKIGNGYIVVYTKNCINCDSLIISENPTLFKEVLANFYGGKDSPATYVDVIDSVYDDRIIIKTQNENIWNIDGFKTFGIDNKYLWDINARFYGETAKTHYDDFVIYKTKITQDAISQQDMIFVEESDEFKIDDDVKIYNNKGREFSSKIKEILSGRKLQLYDVFDYSFLTKDDSYIVLYKTGTSDDVIFEKFNHNHLIKNCEISAISNDNYDLVGYSKIHNHSLTNLINNVTSLIKQSDNGRLIVGGSDSKVYYSDDNGTNWKELIDVYDFIDEDVFGKYIYITSMNIDDDKDLIIGTNVGIIIKQGLDNPNYTNLEYPFTEKYLPSSSSSSSESSASSPSSLSSSSSVSSQSTSSNSSSSSSSTSSINSSSSSSSTSSLSSSSSSSSTSSLSSST